MTYTREMELQYLAAEDAVKNAEAMRRPMMNARNELLDSLGSLLQHCPQESGTRGAAMWAIRHADKLTAMLAPFVTPPAK